MHDAEGIMDITWQKKWQYSHQLLVSVLHKDISVPLLLEYVIPSPY